MFNPERGASSDFYSRNSTQPPSKDEGHRHSSRDRDRDRDRDRKRNRWDQRDNGNSHSHRERDRDNSYRRRSRSRSPARNSSHSESISKKPDLNPNGARVQAESTKKPSNNWSDSSSDEETNGHGFGYQNKRAEGDKNTNESLYSRWDKRPDKPEGLIGAGGDGRPNLNLNPFPDPPRPVLNYNPPEALKSVNNNQEDGGNNKGFGFIRASPNTGTNAVVGAPKAPTGIQMKLLTQLKPAPAISPVALKPKPNVASVFNVDDDDEPEEMPPECKMRMKNVGRETPTSAGPNSFGKTKIGFCNVIQIKERKIQEQLQKK